MWERRHRHRGDGGGWKEWEKSNSSNSLLLTASRHSLYPPIQLLISKSDPEPATNRTAPAPLPRCISEFRFDRNSLRLEGGGFPEKLAMFCYLNWTQSWEIVHWFCPPISDCHSTAIQLVFTPSNSVCHSGLQIAEIIHRPLLHFSYKSNDIRLDFP